MTTRAPLSLSPLSTRPRGSASRGYALLVVMIAALVLAGISAALIQTAGSDRFESHTQMNSVKALYAAEAAVAAGVDELKARLESEASPTLTDIEPPLLPDVKWEGASSFKVAYVNPNDNYKPTGTCVSDADCPGEKPGACTVDNTCRYSFTTTLTSGDYKGLDAEQTPLQVLVTSDVRGARATIGDVLLLNQVPVFQFGIFFDGDLEFQSPATMELKGRIHTNGNLYPIRDAASDNTLTFYEPITVAGYQHRCTLFDDEACFTAASSNTFIDTTQVTEGKEDHATDAQQATYHQTTFGDMLKDKSRGVEELHLPIAVDGEPPDVISRPDKCGATSDKVPTFSQSPAIGLIKRPDGGYGDTLYSEQATSGYEVTYGPSPANVAASDVSEACGAANLGRAHCQAMTTKSVPLLAPAFDDDDGKVSSERMYWKAHIRIIDGIWYDRDNKVIFDPEDWSLNGISDATNAKFLRGLRFARVLRYSWFWDPRESRVYETSPRFQRGLQIRATDFDMWAFNQLLQDAEAVDLIFGVDGIPDGGVVVYVSETYDPTYDDNGTLLHRASNVRNFLDFHVMENADPVSGTPEESAMGCLTNAATPDRDTGMDPCQLGWHPFFIWGDGAAALTGQAASTSLTPNPTDLRRPLRPDPADATGHICRNPLTLTTPDLSANPLAPCIEAGATPTGPENAVRLVRGQHLPVVDGEPVGVTLATDNRLYIYGDVNVYENAGVATQEVFGKVAFIADSISLLSQRFSDRVMQRGADTASAWEDAPFYASHISQPQPGHFADAPPAAAGNGPDVCLAWNAIDSTSVTGLKARRPLDLTIYASLLMGDVPSCPGAGSQTGATSGGVNNFPRFLEDFQGAQKVTIMGSMVSLFRSEQGNARFLSPTWGVPDADDWVDGRTTDPYQFGGGTGCVYTPPFREWGFDTKLTDLANLPPGTPRFFYVDRVRWVRR